MITSKDPDELEAFSFDWIKNLASSETITTSAWATASGDMNFNETTSTVVGVPGHSVNGTITTIWADGGTAGTSTTITNTITTSLGRVLEESVSIPCVEH